VRAWELPVYADAAPRRGVHNDDVGDAATISRFPASVLASASNNPPFVCGHRQQQHHAARWKRRWKDEGGDEQRAR